MAPTAASRVRHADRKAQALAMRIEGASSPEIARALNVSRQTAWRLISGALAERKAEIAERTEELRAIEHERYEQYIEKLRPMALAGDLGAHRALLRWHERLAKLLNLDLREDDVSTAPRFVVNVGIPEMPEPPETVDGTFEEIPAIGPGAAA
jgi:DNA-binding CsgD family transcriptional regulator